MTRPVLAILSAVMACGCVYHRNGMPLSALTESADWTAGVTTRRDIVEKWGNPHKTSDDTWIWKESISNGGKVKASYYLMGITISSTTVSSREHRISFDSDGKMTEWKTSDSIPGGAGWSIWPW